ncbi:MULTISPECIES: GTP cyclohydrolase II [unclassified Novosphingobium]|uniref:GTP cyclohydrolase II n=1 Tax=Novosphingobium TaxID=165696 RepID=UPI00144858C1|nr:MULTISPECIES: GTP cyclohydrolase II [unclassified Novosphingobium]NKJ43224.1 GTP cyclohydrolase II [Novosphingobium sp. SG720]NMN07083.1 GTP cyclohydrolase II [Novosphingobium sp. SG919]NMN89329.1 GTP cyclohydrolase II [Novosphingobium sp. SG916]
MTTPAAATRRVARALDALRHGWAIRVTDAAGAFDLLPAETGFAQPGLYAAQMLISAARAATLKLTNQRDAALPHAPVLIHAAEPFTLAMARDLADPAHDLGSPLRGPFRATPIPAPEAAGAAMELARLAGILPAFLVASGVDIAETVAVEDMAAFTDPLNLTIQARARLPVDACEEAEIIAFRARDDLREHVALIVGQQDNAVPPLVRLHSECLTGDILGSLKCDCGPQLQAALARMAAQASHGGWGVLLYLRQEGRGIGLINKLRAYQLQDQGFDTVDANERLGLPSEARDFPVAARMLDLIGARRIRLMTNNPAKVAALEALGVTVLERVAHQLPANPHNARYLDTKRDRTGHLLK